MTCSWLLEWILLSIPLWNYARGDDVADPNFFPRLVGDYIPQNCWNFTYGDWRMREFYSPRYPHNYINDTSCIQQLIAPRGYRIRLDFRDDFHIEISEECKYDYLELRDGPYGYSPLIGRYCGKQHPPMIESSHRYLWIRFQSDDSIEYRGFRAVYDFFVPGLPDVRNPENYTGYYDYSITYGDDVCRIEVDISDHDGSISSQDVPRSFITAANQTNSPVDCTWVIYTPPGHRTWIVWQSFHMTTTESCEDSFIEMYDRTTAVNDRRSLYCGNTNRNVRSHSNHLYLRSYADRVDLIPQFEAMFTLYTTGSSGECPPSKFQCEYNVCINNTLVCNGRDNCRPAKDEERCRGFGDSVGGLWPHQDEELDKLLDSDTTEEPPLLTDRHVTILGVVSGCLLVVVAIAIYVTCKQHKKETIRRNHALKQEDRRNTIELTNLLHNGDSPRRGHGASHGALPVTPTANHTRRNGSLERKSPSSHSSHTVPNHSSASIPNHSRHNGYASGHYRHGNEGARRSYSGDDLCAAEYSDPIASGSGTPSFKRFLGIEQHDGEESSPNASCNRIPAVVTIERGAVGTSGANSNAVEREHLRNNSSKRRSDGRGPSPRPDLVQEVDYMYPDTTGSKMKRDISGEFSVPESNDTWKYMSDVTTVVPSSSSKNEDWYNSMERERNYQSRPASRNTTPRNSQHKEHGRSRSNERVKSVQRQLDWEDSTYVPAAGRSLDDQGHFYDEPGNIQHHRQSNTGRRSPEVSRRRSPSDSRGRNKSPLSRKSSPRRQRSFEEGSPKTERRARQEAWQKHHSKSQCGPEYSPDQFYTRPKPRSNWSHHPV